MFELLANILQCNMGNCKKIPVFQPDIEANEQGSLTAFISINKGNHLIFHDPMEAHVRFPGEFSKENGGMFRNILVVFEDEKIAEEALIYAREFALRVDAPVTLLMLIPMTFAGRTFLGSKRNTIKKTETRAGALLADCASSFIQQGIEVSSALKLGDPAQELMKFLADRPPFQAIIWGSGKDLPTKGPLVKRHWISKVAGNLECPLLTVSKKES